LTTQGWIQPVTLEGGDFSNIC